MGQVLGPIGVSILGDHLLIPRITRLLQIRVVDRLKEVRSRQVIAQRAVMHYAGQVKVLHIHREAVPT